jgi:ribosome-associated protein
MTRHESRRKAATPELPEEVRAAAQAAYDKKASDVVVLDLRAAAAFTDFFVICSGENPRQVGAIADAVEAALKARDLRPTHVEGRDRGEWVLLDYFDIVVHVFTRETREFYSLERLWGNATAVPVADENAPPERAPRGGPAAD